MIKEAYLFTKGVPCLWVHGSNCNAIVSNLETHIKDNLQTLDFSNIDRLKILIEPNFVSTLILGIIKYLQSHTKIKDFYVYNDDKYVKVKSKKEIPVIEIDCGIEYWCCISKLNKIEVNRQYFKNLKDAEDFKLKRQIIYPEQSNFIYAY